MFDTIIGDVIRMTVVSLGKRQRNLIDVNSVGR